MSIIQIENINLNKYGNDNMEFFGFTLIIGILSLSFIYHLILKMMAYHSCKKNLPSFFHDTIQPEEYKNNQEYNRSCLIFAIISQIFLFIITISFLSLNGISTLYNYSLSFGWNLPLTGTIFFLILVITSQIINIPLAFYRNFVIEEKYNLNTNTKKGFLLDNIKELILSIILITPILYLCLWFFQSTPLACLFCSITVIIYQFFLIWIAPLWIAPLFHKFTPLPPSDLKKSNRKILSYL